MLQELLEGKSFRELFMSEDLRGIKPKIMKEISKVFPKLDKQRLRTTVEFRPGSFVNPPTYHFTIQSRNTKVDSEKIRVGLDKIMGVKVILTTTTDRHGNEMVVFDIHIL